MSPNEPPTSYPLPPAGTSAWVTIDLGAIADNVRELDRRAGSAEVMAVVKANAYGHGLVPSARAALRGGATWLGVAQLDEAFALRDAGITAPVLAWLYPPGADLQGALERDIDISCGSVWAVEAVAAAAAATGRTARVHLKVDTGLGRGGALQQGWLGLLEAAGPYAAAHTLEVVGIWSHFAWADAPEHPTVRRQRKVFVEALADAKRLGIVPQVRHLANSAATLTNAEAHFDLVRPGLAVYGLSPVPQLGGPEEFSLREAMRVCARLTSVKAAPARQGVSYAHAYKTPTQTLLGLVPMGYADGIPRSASNQGPVQVNGQRHVIAGRVCMDQFVLDLGPGFTGRAGDEVVLIGEHAIGEPTAEEWARATGTINYEIVTRISSRLPRVWLGDQG